MSLSNLAVLVSVALAPGDMAGLPVNTWVRLPARNGAGYTCSQPIYVPSRGQVLHWGAVEIGDPRPYFRNDVLAFDARAGQWASDYPPAEKLPGLLEGFGKGVYYKGTGEMLPCGTPAPSMVVNGACYDPVRNQVIYTMKVMAAYDPAGKTWRDMKAATELYGELLPGGPPVYGAGTCYDPRNDEIVLFPHWGGTNTDLRRIDGRVSGHCGTFLYSFCDNRWRRAAESLGTEKVRRERKEMFELMGQISSLLDEAWLLRAQPDAAKARELEKRLSLLAGEDKDPPARDIPARMEQLIRSGSRVLRSLQAIVDKSLAVEPPPRCGAPMVYDPAHQAIVLFGGQDGLVRTDLGETGGPGALNDTWLYDVVKRQWRRLPCRNRPPVQRRPHLVYDGVSKLVLLVTRDLPADGKHKGIVTIWALDVEAGQWTRLREQAWEWPFSRRSLTGWTDSPFELALDEKSRLLVLTQNVYENRTPVGETYVLRLDVGAMESEAAPAWRAPPPVRPIEIPPDDPAWVAQLRALPANTWVAAKPPREPRSRDWGNAACDPVRGWVVYFGGGHATYQINNPAIYVVGANRWVTTAGDHNDWVPPVGWGGVAMGLRGGAHAHHQRNEYVALDGRMYRSLGGFSRRWGVEQAVRPGDRYTWLFDIDRGGLWRQIKIAAVRRDPNVPGTYGVPHVVDPAGRVMGFGGALEPYDGRMSPKEAYFALYDVRANTLSVRALPAERPGCVLECRPFCFLTDRNQVFFFEFRGTKAGEVFGQGTWVYDIAANRFTRLRPEWQPKGEPGTVVYLPEQKAVFAVIFNARSRKPEQWVYSLERSKWRPLPSGGLDVPFASPYTQLVYVARYGVLVNLPKTAVMRPDVSQVAWDRPAPADAAPPRTP